MAFIGTLVFLYAAIGTTFKSKIAIDQGLLQNQLPVSVKIFEDYYYGPFPSSGNQYLDLIYTDFRYRVIGNAMKRYYSDKNTTVTDPLSKPFRSLNMQGHRSLCAFMSMPFVFRSLSTDVSGESNTFNDYVLLQIEAISLQYASMGQFFTESLSDHMLDLMGLQSTVISQTELAIKQAYNRPYWGTTSDKASSACTKSLLAIR